MPSGTKPSGLTAFSGAIDRTNDLALIWDNSASLLKKLSWSQVRQGIYNAIDYGADATGTEDSAAAFQAALDAIAASSVGGELYIPAGNYKISTALTYDWVAGAYPLRIIGHGAASKLIASGADNKIIYFTGISGATHGHLYLKSFQVYSNTSGTCPAAIHLDQIAIFGLEDIFVDGNSKMTNGMQFTGTQQGYIKGGYLTRAENGMVFEDDGSLVSSNGIMINGVSFACSEKNVSSSGVDTMFFIGNHMTSAPIHIDIVAPVGNSSLLIQGNALEQHTTAAIRCAGSANIFDNSFAPGTSGNDILINGGSKSMVMFNDLQGSSTIAAEAENTIWANNFSVGSGTFTNNSPSTTIYGNIGTGAVAKGGVLFDSLTLTSRAESAGHMLELKPNALVSGNWGMKLSGAGSGDVYLQLQDTVIAGSTSGNVLKFMSGIGGTQWARVFSDGIEVGVAGSPQLAVGYGAPGSLDKPNGSIYMRTDGTGPNVYFRVNGSWVAAGTA